MTQRRTYTIHATPDLEIRTAGDGRMIRGICAPFNTPARIPSRDGEFTEQFRRGAFDRTIRERGPAKVKLLAEHQSRSLPIGRAVLLREDVGGLYGEFKVSKTQVGDDVLELIRDGALDSFSVGFRSIRDAWSSDRSQREVIEAALAEVSVVNFGAYSAAQIHSVRQQVTPQLLAAQQRLNTLTRST